MAACIIGFIDNKMECVTKIEYGVLGNRIGVSKMLLAKSNVLTYLILYFFFITEVQHIICESKIKNIYE